MFKIVCRLGLFFTLAVALMTLSGSMALANGDPPPTPEPGGPHADKIKQLREYVKQSVGKNLPSSASLVNWDQARPGQSGAGNTTFSTQFDPNPYGCIGKTDDPHKSTHSGGTTINVVARTTCDVNVKEIHVDTQLYVKDCPWFWCGWSVYNNAPLGQQTLPNAKLAQANSAAPPCINQEYKGISGHWITGNDGNFYWAVTQNPNNVTNC